MLQFIKLREVINRRLTARQNAYTDVSLFSTVSKATNTVQRLHTLYTMVEPARLTLCSYRSLALQETHRSSLGKNHTFHQKGQAFRISFTALYLDIISLSVTCSKARNGIWLFASAWDFTFSHFVQNSSMVPPVGIWARA